jgi:gas vesicle protein
VTNASDDPDQIRAEIERTQSTLGQDVDALTEKVTPSRIVERRVGRVRSSMGRWKDSVMGTMPTGSGAPGTVSQTAQSVSGAASGAASNVSEAASSGMQAVQEAPQAIRRQAQGNPLAAGLIAFGAGWLVSSLLPASRKEQQLAGQAKDKIQQVGPPLAQAAGQAAAEVKENLREPAQQAVESVRSTATEAGRTVSDEGRTAAEQVQGRAQDAAGTVRERATNQ